MLGMLAFAAPAFAANDVPVPTECTADVNAALANVVASKTKRDIDNIIGVRDGGGQDDVSGRRFARQPPCDDVERAISQWADGDGAGRDE